MKSKRALYRILFEPKTIDAVAPVPKAIYYCILFFWTVVCLFPLY